MKYKTTAKAIRQSGETALAIGYCDLADLLRYENPIAYTCGVYGWNFDVYKVNGINICTGYRGMVGKSVDYEITREYNGKARKINSDWSIPYEEKREKVNALLMEFLKKAA